MQSHQPNNRLNNHVDHQSNCVSELNVAPLCQEVLPIWYKQIEAARQLTNSSIEMMSHQFAALSHRVQAVAEGKEVSQQVCQQINAEISELLVSLQFQDRVSQMLQHVENDMQKLHVSIQEHTSINTEEWLKALAATYAMQEQHAIHNACLNTDTDATNQPNLSHTHSQENQQDPQGLTFF